MAFGWLKNLFKLKKTEQPKMPETRLPEVPRTVGITTETTATENVKAKMDLVLTQLDSLRIQYETLNERIKNLERLVQEIYQIARSA